MIKRPRSLGLLLPVLIALIGAVYFYHWAMAPVNSKLTMTASTPDLIEGTKTQKITGTYFGTLAPVNMRIQQDKISAVGSPILEQMLILSNNIQEGDTISITIGRLPAGGLLETSGAKLRSTQPDIYKLLNVFSSAPNGALIYSKQDVAYEKSVFWIKDNMYAAVVASGNLARTNQLDTLLAQVLKNWHWTE